MIWQSISQPVCRMLLLLTLLLGTMLVAILLATLPDIVLLVLCVHQNASLAILPAHEGFVFIILDLLAKKRESPLTEMKHDRIICAEDF